MERPGESRELVFYIPKNVDVRFEFLPGLGWRELARLVPFLATGVGFMLLAPVPAFPRFFVPFLVLALGWFLFCVPAFEDLTAWEFIQRARAFRRGQRVFCYRRKWVNDRV